MKTANRFFNWRLLDPANGDGAAGGGPAEPTGDGGPADESFFSDLAAHDDAEPVAEPAAPVVEPAAPVSPPAVTPPAASAPATPPGVPSSPAPAGAPATPAVVPPGAPAADGTQQPPASSTPPAPPEAPIDFAKHREEFLPKLATLYALDEADVEAARTDPGKVLPTLAARVHYEVQQAVFAGVMQSMPQMLEMFSARTREAEKNEETFFSQFPALKEKPEYAPTVINSIKAIKAANPNMSQADVIKQSGIMASLTLGLPLPGATPPPNTPPPPAPNLAAMRPAGAGSVAHVTPPITPAAPGAEGFDADLAGLIDAHLDGSI